MSRDAELLRCYAEEHSEAAFAEAVRLHANLLDLCGAVFEVLMKCLLVSVAVLFVAAIILIILCCNCLAFRMISTAFRSEPESH